MTTCCCNPRPRACSRERYLEVDGVGALLKRPSDWWLRPSSTAGVDGGPFQMNHLQIPTIGSLDSSALFRDTPVPDRYGSDFAYLGWKDTGQGWAFGSADNFTWDITVNTDASGFSSKQWEFRGIVFDSSWAPEDDYGNSSSPLNFCYVWRFQWRRDSIDYTADVYIPESPLRDWDTKGKGIAGPYVMFKGRKYTCTTTRDTVVDIGDSFEESTNGDPNDLILGTFPLDLVYGAIAWQEPDIQGTTTTSAGTTTTSGNDRWAIAFSFTPSGKYDYLCYANKGTDAGLVPVVGRWQFRSSCDETQSYSVSDFGSTQIKHHTCTDYAKEWRVDSAFPSDVSQPFSSSQEASCAIGSTTTTGEVFKPWTYADDCNLDDFDCIGRNDENHWATPINCLYTVTANGRTWSLLGNFISSGGSYRTRTHRVAAAYYRTYRYDKSPIGDLRIINRIVGTETEPWLVLRLGFVRKVKKAFGSDYLPGYFAAYGMNIADYGAVDFIRDADVEMSRIWQYGEDIHLCNDLELIDKREHQDHNYPMVSGFTGQVFPASGFEVYTSHPYEKGRITVVQFYNTSNRDKYTHEWFDLGKLKTGVDTTPSTYAATFTKYDKDAIPAKWSSMASGSKDAWIMTDPKYVTRPMCSTIEDAPTDQELEDLPPGDYSVTVSEYWVDYPATITLEAK